MCDILDLLKKAAESRVFYFVNRGLLIPRHNRIGEESGEEGPDLDPLWDLDHPLPGQTLLQKKILLPRYITNTKKRHILWYFRMCFWIPVVHTSFKPHRPNTIPTFFSRLNHQSWYRNAIQAGPLSLSKMSRKITKNRNSACFYFICYWQHFTDVI